MMKKLFALAAALAAIAPTLRAQDVARWEHRAADVTILRDTWGIAHVYGKTDADAVFGMIYAQAEDDFTRVETNYINAMGRLAEAEGARAIYQDLRMKLFIDPDSMKAQYRASPAWLRALMDAWADGLNYYLSRHPDVKPRVITRFEPWMALTFSEGSIGGDIEEIKLPELRAFYGRQVDGTKANDVGSPPPPPSREEEPRGSNGIAIAPGNTINHRALLLINPHTTFFFRSEAQVHSDEGLNAYGASTWGQFFVYQGFNDRLGWMHTSSNVDAIDEYAETVTRKDGKWYYHYANDDRPMVTTKIVVPFKTDSGMSRREFTVYRTHHGPVVREMDGKWISVRLMQEPVKALTQSYTRTKARDFKSFKQIMELHTNSSNNTVYADANGNIAYFHANFIPRRDTSFDWTKPVDGATPATEWRGLLSVDESPNIFDPPTGWLYNTNDAPWTNAGDYSPKKSRYPAYVETGEENARGVHATRVLSGRRDFSIDALRNAAFDSYMPAFDSIIPPLLKAYEQTSAENPVKARLAEQVDVLRGWDRRWSATSIPTTIAVFLGEELGGRRRRGVDTLQALAAASDTLTARFGTWKTPWGEVNRFQRLTGDLTQPFNDAAPSIPVEFASAKWGSLASFGYRELALHQTKKIYGTTGNSFVAIVEFGDSVRARAVTAGGESGHPSSPHFNDQATRYATGNLREVYFYRPQVEAHTERQYHPGQ